MATNNLTVTELDFDRIKQNLKDYLRDPTLNPDFQDYDFDASGLNILIDLLAYNTHYNAYYLNMVSNEAFLDTAKIRSSVVSHAKTLGYTPYSATAPVAYINFTVETSDNSPGELIIPANYQFLSNQIDGTSYSFNVLEDVKATKSGDDYVFENLPIYEGQVISYQFTYNEQTNSKQVFTLPDENIDSSTIKVLVLPSPSSTTSTVHTRVDDILDVTSTSEIYFLQESRTGQYEIYFGDNVIGKKLTNGSVVIVSYLITNGSAANKANNFIATTTLFDSVGNEPLTTLVVVPVSEAAGGSENQSIDSIKYSASARYSAQNRLVTYNDYNTYILTNYPSVDSVSVWGGENESPPVYGKVFISLKPKSNFYISELEKQRIISDIINPKSVISVQTIIRDPEYVYVKLNNLIRYDSKKTILTQEVLKSSIKNIILDYFDLTVNKFNSTFALSKLQEEIDNSDSSIIGVQTSLRLEKRLLPKLLTRATYTINFNAPLYRGSLINRLFSDEFDLFDNTGTRRSSILEETPEGYTGLTNITITNPGTGYTSTPTVTITGDGTGATAVAKVINGRVESIAITSRGVNYSRALISINGGGGFGATAVTVLDTRFGVLRTVYFDENAQRQIINPNAGTINYDTGELTLNNITILSTPAADGYIRINAESENDVISSIKNTLLVIDEADSSSIITSLVAV
jgi:hypothetical protein